MESIPKTAKKDLYFFIILLTPRETREGRPLLTVETEVNGDSRSTNQMKEALPLVDSLGSKCRYKRFCPALVAIVGPAQNIFPHRTLFQFLCHHRPASWAGSRGGSPVS